MAAAASGVTSCSMLDASQQEDKRSARAHLRRFFGTLDADGDPVPEPTFEICRVCHRTPLAPERSELDYDTCILCLPDWRAHAQVQDRAYLAQTDLQYQLVGYESAYGLYAELWRCSRCGWCIAISHNVCGYMRDFLHALGRQLHEKYACEPLVGGASRHAVDRANTNTIHHHQHDVRTAVPVQVRPGAP